MSMVSGLIGLSSSVLHGHASHQSSLPRIHGWKGVLRIEGLLTHKAEVMGHIPSIARVSGSLKGNMSLLSCLNSKVLVMMMLHSYPDATKLTWRQSHLPAQLHEREILSLLLRTGCIHCVGAGCCCCCYRGEFDTYILLIELHALSRGVLHDLLLRLFASSSNLQSAFAF